MSGVTVPGIPGWAIVVLGALYLLCTALSAVLLYAIARTAIQKSTPENLDKVLRAVSTIRMPLPRLRSFSAGRRDNSKELQ